MHNSINKKDIFSVLAFTSIGLLAGCGMTGVDYAEVTNVTAITKTVTIPREECHNEVVTLQKQSKDPNRIVGTVTGAVIGGVLGNEIGSGKGNDAATVGGAVIGGYAGNQVQEEMQEGNTVQENRQVCETVNDTREEPAGYQVTYRLNGEEHTVHMDHDPGRRIPLENGVVAL